MPGLGTTSLEFYNIQQLLAQKGIRSCSYDRSGTGFSDSDPLKNEATLSYRVNELLEVAKLTPNYESSKLVLAGSSLGGKHNTGPLY